MVMSICGLNMRKLPHVTDTIIYVSILKCEMMTCQRRLMGKQDVEHDHGIAFGEIFMVMR